MTSFAAEAEDPERWFHELLGKAQRGDREAVDQLMAEVRRYLLTIANRQMPERLRPEFAPSDFVQETSMKLFQRLSEFRGTLPGWRAYARVILINLMFRKSGKATIPIQPLAGELVDPAESPRQSLSEQELRGLLNLIRAGLKPEYQRVLQLRDEGLGWREIGLAMQRDADAARKLWHRAFLQFTDRARAAGLLDHLHGADGSGLEAS